MSKVVVPCRDDYNYENLKLMLPMSYYTTLYKEWIPFYSGRPMD